MNNVKITDTIIYVIWAWQGILIQDISATEDDTLLFHISVPSTTFVKDENGNPFTYVKLLPKVKMMFQILTTSMLYNQHLKTKFEVEERADNWTLEEGKIAVQDITTRMFFINPFEGVM